MKKHVKISTTEEWSGEYIRHESAHGSLVAALMIRYLMRAEMCILVTKDLQSTLVVTVVIFSSVPDDRGTLVLARPVYLSRGLTGLHSYPWFHESW